LWWFASSALDLKEPNIMCGRRLLIVSAVVVVAAFSLLAAGCGGGSPGIASVASSTPAAATTQNKATTQNGPLAFSRCMRSKGVLNFPDPNSSGAIPKVSLQQLEVSSSQFEAAQKACRNLLPSGSRPSQTASRQMQSKMLQFSHCMRSHGVSNWPDPTASTPLAVAQGARPYMFQLGGLQGLDGRSFPPQITAAMTECEDRTGAQVAYSG
jgi:hypothetical protein